MSEIDLNFTLPDNEAERRLINELDKAARKTVDTGGKATAHELAYLLKLMEDAQQRLKYAGIEKWFIPDTPYEIDRLPKHKSFFDAGNRCRQRMFMAGNRCGKTISGAYETACHVTGLYPDWWTGRRFERPVRAWACGKTGQTTRDTVQKELFGMGAGLGTGMIPRDRIVRTTSRPGVPGALDTVEILHKTGDISTLGIKSYDQDEQAFFGTAMDVVWMDEEPPLRVYNECLIRTMTTGGIVYVTVTPLLGLTPFIVEFMKDAEFGVGYRPNIVETIPDDGV